MAARTFEDSAGRTWEVFEVHRASDKPGAVSAGLEQGWLAFDDGTEKRRLAPFPADWEQAEVTELERLCANARIAGSRVGGAADAVPPTREPAARPRIRSASPVAASTPAATASPVELAEVDAFIRAFAHESRTSRLPAVEAMVRMKAALLEHFPGEAHPARDSRLVRRSFVDAYYFERQA